MEYNLLYKERKIHIRHILKQEIRPEEATGTLENFKLSSLNLS